MRVGSKQFQYQCSPSNGDEWYEKRAVNNVDLETAMSEVLQAQQVQNLE